MRHLLVTSALSMVVHGAGVVVLGVLARSDVRTPPRVMEIILPDLGGSATSEAHTSSPAEPRAWASRPARRAARAAVSSEASRALPEPPRATPPPARESPPASVEPPAPEPPAAPPVVSAPLAPTPARDPEVAEGLSVTFEVARGPADAAAVETPSAKPSGVGWGGASSRAGRPSPEEGASLAAHGSDVGTRDGGASAAASPGPLSFATPRYRDNANPAYPWQARLRGEQGTVLLSVLVDARGRVGELRVERSSGSRVLDEAAVAAVRRWTFEPGRRGAEAVESWVRIPLRFHLED